MIYHSLCCFLFLFFLRTCYYHKVAVFTLTTVEHKKISIQIVSVVQIFFFFLQWLTILQYMILRLPSNIIHEVSFCLQYCCLQHIAALQYVTGLHKYIMVPTQLPTPLFAQCVCDGFGAMTSSCLVIVIGHVFMWAGSLETERGVMSQFLRALEKMYFQMVLGDH